MKKPSMVLLHIGINWHGISSRTYIKIQPPLAFRSDLKILYLSMLNCMEGDDSPNFVFGIIMVLCYLQSEKFKSLFCKINTFAKNYHLHWIADRANILSKYIIHILFNLGRGFYGSFPMLFPKAPACCKKI